VRVADNLVRHFPWRSMVDPYVGFGRVQDTATAPFYDWLLGLIAWVAGAGSPSESLVHGIAAWYPVALAACTVVAVFLLARLALGLRAALLAAAIVATLPGHFCAYPVSVLRITTSWRACCDAVLYLLLRALERPFSLWTAATPGLTLAAYLLTFHGSALVVGIVVTWGFYDRIRSQWPRDQPELSFLPLYTAFFVALCVCVVFRNLLWMNYSIAALALGIVAIGVLEIWGSGAGDFPAGGLYSLADWRLPGWSPLLLQQYLCLASVTRPGVSFRALCRRCSELPAASTNFNRWSMKTDTLRSCQCGSSFMALASSRW